MFFTLLDVIFPAFGLILIGWSYAKIRPEVSTKSLNDICLYIGIPAIILKDMVGMDVGDVQVGLVLLASLAATFIPALFGYIWLKAGRHREMGLLLPIAFFNGVNLPVPIINLYWGEPGVAVAAVYFTLESILLFIFGVIFAAEKDKFKEVLKLPYIYAFIVVFIMNGFDLAFPKFAGRLIEISADMAYPLMLVVMGIILGRSKIKIDSGKLGLSIKAALIRIIGGTVALTAVVFLLGAEGLNKEVLLFYGVMPGAIATTLFAEKYKRDSELVAQAVFIGTLISLVLIPIVLIILGCC